MYLKFPLQYSNDGIDENDNITIKYNVKWPKKDKKKGFTA